MKKEPMIGISLYLSNIDFDYFYGALQHGVKSVFCSLLINKEHEVDVSLLKRINEVAYENEVDIIYDLNCEQLHKLFGYEYIETMHELGIKILRIDELPIELSLLRELQANFSIYLNGSRIEESELLYLHSVGIVISDISILYNFYPKVGTGLERSALQDKNCMFRRVGIKTIGCFVCGDLEMRYPIYSGLPTLEDHRYVSPYVAILDLIENFDIDCIFIGDTKVRLHIIKHANLYIHTRCCIIPAFLYFPYQSLYSKVFHIRNDSSAIFLRLQQKVEYVDMNTGTYSCMRGMITIDNHHYEKYCGNVQILKQDLAWQISSDLIGFINPQYSNVIDFIKPGKIIFEEADYFEHIYEA